MNITDNNFQEVNNGYRNPRLYDIICLIIIYIKESNTKTSAIPMATHDFANVKDKKSQAKSSKKNNVHFLHIFCC